MPQRPPIRPDDIADNEAVEAAPAVSVAVLHQGKVLLVRRGREPAKGLYAFPGGRVEPGETLEEAARREVMEETGLRLDALVAFQTVTLSAVRDGVPVRYRLNVFKAHAHHGTPVAGDDAEAVGWFGLTDLESLPMSRSMADAARDVLMTGETPNAAR